MVSDNQLLLWVLACSMTVLHSDIFGSVTFGEDIPALNRQLSKFKNLKTSLIGSLIFGCTNAFYAVTEDG